MNFQESFPLIVLAGAVGCFLGTVISYCVIIFLLNKREKNQEKKWEVKRKKFYQERTRAVVE